MYLFHTHTPSQSSRALILTDPNHTGRQTRTNGIKGLLAMHAIIPGIIYLSLSFSLRNPKRKRGRKRNQPRVERSRSRSRSKNAPYTPGLRSETPPPPPSPPESKRRSGGLSVFINQFVDGEGGKGGKSGG